MFRALLLAAAAGGAGAATGSWSAVDELLSNTVFSLGTISFADNSSGITVEVGNLELSKLSVGDLSVRSALAPGGSRIAVNLTLAAAELHLHASPFALYVGGSGGNGTADGRLTLGMELGMVFYGDVGFDFSPPTHSFASHCAATIGDLELQCRGGGLLLTAACALFRTAVKPLVNTVLCGDGESGMIPQALMYRLPPLLANFSRWAAETERLPLPQPPPPAAAEAPFEGQSGLFEFNSSAAVGMLTTVLNKVYGAPSPSGGGLVVNDVLRHLSHNSSAWVIPLHADLLPAPAPLFPGLRLTALSVESLAMDAVAFSELELLETLGRYTTAYALKLSGTLNVTLRVSLVTEGPTVQPAGAVVEELVTLSVNLTDLAVRLRVVAAADTGRFANLTLGGLTASWLSMLGCLADPIVPGGLSVTYLGLSLGAVNRIGVHMQVARPALSSPGGGVNALIDNALAAVGLMYGPTLRRLLPHLASEGVLEKLNALINSTAAGPHPCVPAPAATRASPRTIHFPNNTLVSILNVMLNEVTGFIGAPFDVNHVIDALAEAQGGPAGTFTWPAVMSFDNKGQKMAGVDLGRIAVNVQNLTVSRLDTASVFRVVQPPAGAAGGPDDYKLDTQLAFRGPALSVQTAVHFQWTGVGPAVDDSMQIGLALHDLGAVADLFAEIDSAKVGELRLAQLADPGCVMQAITPAGFRIIDFIALARGLNMSILCADHATGANRCSSPLLPALGDNLATPEAGRILTNLFDKTMRMTNRTLGGAQADAEYDRWVAEAECPRRPAGKSTTDDTPGELVLFFVVGGVTGLVVGGLMVLVGVRARRLLRQHDADRPPSTMNADPRNTRELLKLGQAMFWHPSTGSIERWLVPFALVAGVACLLSANIDPTATFVDVDLALAGDDLAITHVFDFSLHTAVVDMWNAGVYPLALVVALFSGAWAYTKLLLLLLVWFLPPTVLYVSERTALLEFMDFFGKYSLVDLFVMVMLVVSFRLHMALPTTGAWAIVPEGFVVVDLYVKPGWGLFGYVASIVVALFCGHTEIVRHRNLLTALAAEEREKGVTHVRRSSTAAFHPVDKVAQPCREESAVGTHHTGNTAMSTQSSWFFDGQEDLRKEALVSHVFKRNPFPGFMTQPADEYYTSSRKGGGRFTVLRTSAKVVVTFCLICTLGLMILGACIHSFSFTFRGLAAAAVDITPGGETHKSYSVVTLPIKMMEQADGFADYIGYGFIFLVVFMTTFIVPVLQFLGLLCIWCLPLTIVQHKFLFFVNECLAASSAVEVFIISMMAALLQIQQFAQFVVGDKCDALKEPMALLSRLGFYPPDQSKCFDVVAYLEPGCWVLFASSAISNIVYAMINHANKIAIAERERSGAHFLRRATATGKQQHDDADETDTASEDDAQVGQRGGPTHALFSSKGIPQPRDAVYP